MDDNQWIIYEHMKKTWRRTGKILTATQVKDSFPSSSWWAVKEGIIEFKLAYENSFKHEHDFAPEYQKPKHLPVFYEDFEGA